MQELVVKRSRLLDRINIKALAKGVAISLGITSLYILICYANPALAKSAMGGFVFGKTLRLANILRAFSLISPGGAIGVALGAWYFNVLTGTVGLSFGYLVLPFAHLGGGLTVHFISKKVGRSFFKDLLLLGTYGLFMGIVITLHLTSLAIFVKGETWSALFTAAAATKISSNIIITMMGYPLIRGWEKVIGRGRDIVNE